MSFFIVQVSDEQIKREKLKARHLKKTRWWQRKIADGRCHYCGRVFKPAELTMDHVVPLIRGGKSTKGNIVPACKECNSKKKYMLPIEWQEYLERIKRADENGNTANPGI